MNPIPCLGKGTGIRSAHCIRWTLALLFKQLPGLSKWELSWRKLLGNVSLLQEMTWQIGLLHKNTDENTALDIGTIMLNWFCNLSHLQWTNTSMSLQEDLKVQNHSVLWIYTVTLFSATL